MLAYCIWAWILWAVLWYLIFYLRYEYKDTVNELRSHLKEANNQVQHLQEELDEYTLQNQILKEETTKLLDKNDNLNEVVSAMQEGAKELVSIDLGRNVDHLCPTGIISKALPVWMVIIR